MGAATVPVLLLVPPRGTRETLRAARRSCFQTAVVRGGPQSVILPSPLARTAYSSCGSCGLADIGGNGLGMLLAVPPI
jgi:hypothetical protein